MIPEVRRFLPIAILAATFLSPYLLSGQSEDSPLDPTDLYPRVGVEVGLSSVWQSGTYTARCGTFVKGSRISPLFALAYDRPFATSFRFEALLGIQGRGVSSSFNSSENVVLETPGGPARATVDFENLGSLSATYVFVMPSAKYYLTRGVYLGAGFSAGALLGATTQYTKNILSKTVVVDDLGLSEVYYPSEESSDPYSKVFEEETRDDASGLGLDGVVYVGAEIRMGSRLRVGPRVMSVLPLTSILSNPDLSLNAMQFLIGVRYNL